MNPTLVDILFLAVTAILGVGCGWCACRRLKLRQQLQGESSKVHDVLTRLNSMAELVASDLRSHKRSVAHLTEELAFLDVAGAQAVAEVVNRLVEANQAMEQRLVSAEATLHEQARELEAKSNEACTDSLTQLANRRAFNDELVRRYEEYERLQRPLSVILVDVDRFKSFNDTYGHAVGDEVLRGVAAMLRQTVRGMDLVARYGGEEFGVVLPNTPLVVATAVAERTREAVAMREFRYEGKVYRITVSTGVAELRSSEQVSLLLRRADESLYTSKLSGRNCTHFHDGREVRSLVGPMADRNTEHRDGQKAATTVSQTGPLAPSVLPGTQAEDIEPTEAPRTTSNEELANRLVLSCLVRSRLAEWKRGGKTLTVAMVNVNDMDTTVAECGSALGQLVIQTASRQVMSAVREMDTVGQYTDSCFAIILPRTAQPHATHVAERILKFMADCVVSSPGVRIPVRVSIGLTEAMEGDDVVRLLDRAFATMEAARQAGGSCLFVHKGNWPEPTSSQLTAANSPVAAP